MNLCHIKNIKFCQAYIFMINMSSHKKMLIAYSSLGGCTEEITKKIEETIGTTDVNIDMVKVNDKDQFKKFDLDGLKNYDSILLGSSIIVGKMNKNIHKLLEKLSKDKNDVLKLGIYACCMKACSEEKINEAIQEYLKPSIAKYSLHFELMDAFGGRADFSPNSTMNAIVKKVMKKNMLRDTPGLTEIEPKVYDFRDWDQIGRFASTWKELITK
jgi:menaquinone-dependent protoporphyrinogen IX oxidase